MDFGISILKQTLHPGVPPPSYRPAPPSLPRPNHVHAPAGPPAHDGGRQPPGVGAELRTVLHRRPGHVWQGADGCATVPDSFHVVRRTAYNSHGGTGGQAVRQVQAAAGAPGGPVAGKSREG